MKRARAGGSAPACSSSASVWPGQQLHDEIELPVGGAAEVGDAHDVLVLDEAGGARLDGEALDGVGLGAHLGVQHLERHLLLQEHVIGDEHAPHAALGEPAHAPGTCRR